MALSYKAHFDDILPSSINWKWITATSDGRFSAYYCNEAICKDLGIFSHAQDANTAVVEEVRKHLRRGLRRLSDSEA